MMCFGILKSTEILYVDVIEIILLLLFFSINQSGAKLGP